MSEERVQRAAATAGATYPTNVRLSAGIRQLLGAHGARLGYNLGEMIRLVLLLGLERVGELPPKCDPASVRFPATPGAVFPLPAAAAE